VAPIIRENKVINAAERDIYFKASRLKAMSYTMHSRFQESLATLYRIVSESEMYKDTVTLVENINSIGSVALARTEPADALKWLSRALLLTNESVKYKSLRAAIFVNMADAYSQLNKLDSATINIDKGIKLFKETENLSNLAIALQRQSAIYLAAGKLGPAEAALKDLIEIRRQSGDSAVYVDDNLSLINFYIQTKQVDKAIQYCRAALVTGDLHGDNQGDTKTFTNNINIRLEYYKALARCYKISGDQDGYQKTLEQIITAKDSFYQYNSAHAIAELQTKYDVQKKETTIIQQKLDITRKNNLFYWLLGLAVFIAIISWITFTGYRKREKLKLNLIVEKEKDLALQSVARAEENERKRIAADLHDSLGAYAASIVSNLDFISSQPENVKKSAALLELRNNSEAMVSQLNDTIWAMKKEGLSLTSISDRIKIFMQRIQPSYPQIMINVIEKIDDDQVLTPAQAFHLFRILQEAITNALKHSKAKEIIVSIEGNNAATVIKIIDDGAGIRDADALKNSSSGLLNMQRRAKEAGWAIAWLPTLPHGTSIFLSPTTN
ncbi:MAG TPA: ATP-binding protein, partial [Chitinophagaceae bacterium]|nr:ATP-binding protein [Chitinophagaceae bacterium]